MVSLEELRNQIDALDEQLCALFERRMDLCIQVADYKRQNNLPVFQGAREQDVIQKAAGRVKNPLYQTGAKRLMQCMMEESKALQREHIGDQPPLPVQQLQKGKTAGYAGVEGAYAQQALTAYFGEDAPRIGYPAFEDVFCALKQGSIAYGVLPIENSTAGPVGEVYDLLNRYHFFIVGEICVDIEHCLAGPKGADLEQVKEVYSHPQAIEQCRAFFAAHEGLKPIPALNTAAAAKAVAEQSDPSRAAIASEQAARLYGLNVLVPSIQDERYNTTRFVVVSASPMRVPGANKNSVVFSLDDKAGTLYNLLHYFFEQGINLVKIESRPQRNSPWEYFLYVDFEGDLSSPEVCKALEGIQKSADYYRLLGSYPAFASKGGRT